MENTASHFAELIEVMKIPYGLHYIDKEDVINVVKALKKRALLKVLWFINLKKICKFLKVKYAVAVSSCTAGMHIV